MIKRKYNRFIQSEQKKFRVKRKLIWILAIVIALFIFFEFCFSQQMIEIIQHQANMIATEVISQAIEDVLSDADMQYEKLSQIKTDSSGAIIAIETDMAAINHLKAMLTSNVTQQLKKMRFDKYDISLGSLIGSEYFIGRGPDVTLKIEPTGYLNTEFSNKFSSAGINQTLHQILLNMTVRINTYIPLHHAIIEVSTNIIVAETVIVGRVPQYYTNVISDDRSLISDLNDYNIAQYPK